VIGRVVVLSGGVGGAKLVDGLARILPSIDLTVVVNTGDDFTHLGLRICPDLDTVVYTLAKVADPDKGWGRAQESFTVLDTLRELGGPDWFQLGDRDLGLHLLRTQNLAGGQTLSRFTSDVCSQFGIGCKVLPMTDQEVSTVVMTDGGELQFQEYFVARKCEPVVTGFSFTGIKTAEPAPGVLEAIQQADAVIFGPSNPWVSIDPILAVPGIRAAMNGKKITAVSPLIGRKALKGPAAKMYTELGIIPRAAAVARHFEGLLSGFVYDRVDLEQNQEILNLGIKPHATDTIMRNVDNRLQLAEEVLDFCATL
jgi:LPPG:FO 2-phospho-L-lactate transferase